jgi:octaprenyl-diphosphate synthase
MTSDSLSSAESVAILNGCESGTSRNDDPSAIGFGLLARALSPVQPQLFELNQCITSYLPAESPTAKAMVSHVFASGGKRIRPALYFLACRMAGYDGAQLYPMASVTEFVHTASLLHDDVVDNSSVRRNRPTANSIWGDESSVLVGDLIYSRASEMMADTGSLEIVRTFARAIRLMSEGELYQLENIFDQEFSIDRYLRIVEYKTAVLIAASCKTAGILAGCTSRQIEALSVFGSSVGMAFQLVDDALDYLGSREIFGKPTRSDLAAGKVTLPVLLLAQELAPADLEHLRSVLSRGSVTPAEVDWVANLVEQRGTAEATIERARRYTDDAQKALDLFPDSPEKSELLVLAETLVWRFN